MLAWYWYIFGALVIFYIYFGIEWLVEFYITWPFEE